MTMATVLQFLKDHRIDVKEDNQVLVRIDEPCDMAEVAVNGKVVMCGNFWDFRPETHGLKLPTFSNHRSLANLFVVTLEAIGKKVTMTEDHQWRYVD
jgi:hypothetical protein